MFSGAHSILTIKEREREGRIKMKFCLPLFLPIHILSMILPWNVEGVFKKEKK